MLPLLLPVYMIPVRGTLKTVLACLLFLGLCGGIVWQTYMILGGWLSYKFDPSADKPEITLEARWIQTFDREGQLPLTSFLNRGSQSIVSTAHSVYAVDMLTGETLWRNDTAAGLFLQTLSSEQGFPLLGLQHDDAGKTTLIRLDPAKGTILWQQTLNGSSPRINFDARHIATLSDARISLYNLVGEQLWQQNFQDGFSPEYIAFHHELLLGHYAEKTVHLKYLLRESGELLWEEKKSEFFPGYVIPGTDQQVFSTEKGLSMLFDVKRKEKLWDSPRDLEHIIGHSADEQSGEIYLHSTKGMVRQQDGGYHVAYPAGFRLVANSDEYLILLQNSGGRQKTCLLLDKSSGATVQQIHDRAWFAIFYLHEDQDAMYLAANSKSQESRNDTIETSVVRLDKHNGDVKEIPVGRNIGAIRFQVFPQEGLVFIPLYQQLGGYLLPEM